TGGQPVRSEESAFDSVEFIHGSFDVLLHDRPVDPPTLELSGHPHPVVFRENATYVARLHRMHVPAFQPRARTEKARKPLCSERPARLRHTRAREAFDEVGAITAAY